MVSMELLHLARLEKAATAASIADVIDDPEPKSPNEGAGADGRYAPAAHRQVVRRTMQICQIA